MQYGSTYADVRIPSDLPDLTGAASLSDLDPRTLLALMASEGFAGTIAVQDSVCTWTRAINWHGTPQTIDAGRMWFDDAGGLIEDGVHADYRELWNASKDPTESALVFETGGQQGFLLASATHFVLALDVRGAASRMPLITALESGRVPDELLGCFDCVYAFGDWIGADGVARYATNPLMQGKPVVTRGRNGIKIHTQTFGGAERSFTVDDLVSA
jgi:hypothetical protein